MRSLLSWLAALAPLARAGVVGGLIIVLVALAVVAASPEQEGDLIGAFTPGIFKGQVDAESLQEKDSAGGAIAAAFERIRRTPAPTARRDVRVIAVAAGGDHSLAAKSDGTVWAWHTLAVKTDGTVWGWGHNESGQIGTERDAYCTEPVPVQVPGIVLTAAESGPVSGVTRVARTRGVMAGSRHSVALKDDGTVWAWGSNGSGQLGDGTTTDRRTPTLVSAFTR